VRLAGGEDGDEAGQDLSLMMKTELLRHGYESAKQGSREYGARRR
jgi:hypothetical protein